MSKYEHLSEKGQRDAVLVESALGGDQNAYAKLMSFYRDQVYYTMYKMVKDSDDADDLTMDAFGKAFSRLDQYVPKFAFSTWLFKIASNNCIDFMRKKRLSNITTHAEMSLKHTEFIQHAMPTDSLNPEQTIVEEQKITHLRLLVSKLKPRYKELIEKRYFEELSYEEIAEELDIPLGTVKAQLFRARDFLAIMLQKTKDTM